MSELIDDSDELWFLALFSPGKSWWSFLLWIAAFATIVYLVSVNENECSAKSCPDGQQAKLMAHECLCATVAK